MLARAIGLAVSNGYAKKRAGEKAGATNGIESVLSEGGSTDNWGAWRKSACGAYQCRHDVEEGKTGRSGGRTVMFLEQITVTVTAGGGWQREASHQGAPYYRIFQ